MFRPSLPVPLLLALVLMTVPLAAEAQTAGKIPRIAFMSTASPPGAPAIDAFRSALRDLGYVENRNITIEWRWGHGTTERFSEFAFELVRLKVSRLSSRQWSILSKTDLSEVFQDLGATLRG